MTRIERWKRARQERMARKLALQGWVIAYPEDALRALLLMNGTGIRHVPRKTKA